MPIWKKILLECVNVFLNNALAFWVFKRLHLFQAVFVVYPANNQYANYFSFRWRQKINAWKPWIVGVIKHPSGARTLTFAISSSEVDIKSEGKVSNLKILHQETKELAKKLGAKSIHFAGIIPGCLKYRRVPRPNTEQEATVIAVVKATQSLREQLGHTADSPIVLLGYKGFIGREVMRKLTQMNLAVRGVEKNDQIAIPCAPHMVINITQPEAINAHVDSFNEYSVLLNEVYPVPCREVLEYLRSKSVQVYHLAGVIAEAWPAFPGAYHGAVPCCGAIPTEHYEVVLKRL